MKLNLILDVYTIMNTLWGQAGPACYATIEFFGTNGAYAIYQILGNYNIRDYDSKSTVFLFQKRNSKVKSLFFYLSKYLNGLTSPYAIPRIYNTSLNRLDGQRWPLPSSFLNEKLTTISITDFGNSNFQRIGLFALTVCSGNL